MADGRPLFSSLVELPCPVVLLCTPGMRNMCMTTLLPTSFISTRSFCRVYSEGQIGSLSSFRYAKCQAPSVHESRNIILYYKNIVFIFLDLFDREHLSYYLYFTLYLCMSVLMFCIARGFWWPMCKSQLPLHVTRVAHQGYQPIPHGSLPVHQKKVISIQLCWILMCRLLPYRRHGVVVLH